MIKNIYPCIWFNGNAQQAVELYCSVFNNSSIIVDNQMVINFQLKDQFLMGLNGGALYTPNASISFFVNCDSIEEIENAWDKFLDGGTVLMSLDKYDFSEKYGWIQDKFGVSWQLSFNKREEVGQKITPTFMFTNQNAGKTEEAINFYTSIFSNSSIKTIVRYTEQDHDTAGLIKHSQFNLGEKLFMAMDSSFEHLFNFSEGISFVISCDTQNEIDYFWENLTKNGKEGNCGWLKDQYGVSWQVVPSILGKLMSNPEKSQKVMQAFLKMKKFDIETLENV